MEQTKRPTFLLEPKPVLPDEQTLLELSRLLLPILPLLLRFITTHPQLFQPKVELPRSKVHQHRDDYTDDLFTDESEMSAMRMADMDERLELWERDQREHPQDTRTDEEYAESRDLANAMADDHHDRMMERMDILGWNDSEVGVV